MKKYGQFEYMNEYNRSHYKSIAIRVRLDETELLDYLGKKENKTEYIVNLIKEDMKKNKK